MDSLTAHYLARELDTRWRTRRVARCALLRNPVEVVLCADGDATAIRVDLSAPDVRVTEVPLPPAARSPEPVAGWVIDGAEAPTDDRRLIVRLRRAGRFRGSPDRRAVLEIGLVPTARGAVLRDDGGGLLAATGSALPRFRAPRPELSPEEVERAAARGDVPALLAGRWMSPPLAAYLCAHPALAAARYLALVQLPSPEPVQCGSHRLPLPLCDDPVRVASLVESALDAPEGQSAVSVSGTRHARAIDRLREEMQRATEAPRLRAIADTLAVLGDAPVPEAIALTDGSRAPLEARPGEMAHAAAERLYRRARSMERALTRIPRRIAELEAAAAAEECGERGGPASPAGAHEAARTRPRVGGRSASRESARRGTAAAPSPAPPRRYRSSGGIEILVGRGAASNDALTFRDARPDEIWLHARGAAGAHVVLRWTRQEPPPARDLDEAAVLAAWHSKARGSSVVPVDWTRRKYVRRVRGGAPGLVRVDRAATLMVRPDGATERRLRGAP